MAVREILLLGNPELYSKSVAVEETELAEIQSVIEDLHDTLLDFRERTGAGRAIAAPQIGVKKRIIYAYIDQPWVIINPELDLKSEDTITLWDDCMSFPELLVRVKRHRTCRLTQLDARWTKKSSRLEGSLSELIQHEYDHLDGVLAVSRAVDRYSFALKSQRHLLP